MLKCQFNIVILLCKYQHLSKWRFLICTENMVTQGVSVGNSKRVHFHLVSYFSVHFLHLHCSSAGDTVCTHTQTFLQFAEVTTKDYISMESCGMWCHGMTSSLYHIVTSLKELCHCFALKWQCHQWIVMPMECLEVIKAGLFMWMESSFLTTVRKGSQCTS